jgi:signal transduction histidine kinase/ABC-type amino acid transport substrate-binding protein/ActR/RegA family two-component response regulator
MWPSSASSSRASQVVRSILVSAAVALFLHAPARADPGRFDRPLVVPTPTDNYPHSFIGPSGTPEGFSVELLDAVARVMDLKLQRKLMPSHDMKPGLLSGQYDILQTYSYDPVRESYAAFSSSHLDLQGGFFINAYHPEIHTIDDLAHGKILIVGRDSPNDHYVRRRLPEARVIYIERGELALQKINAGEYDAAFLTRLTGLPVIERLDLHSVVLFGPPVTDYSVRLCFAVRRDDTELLTRLNEGLAILHRNGEYNRIYERWFGRFETSRVSRAEIVLTALIVLLVALAVAIWAGWRQRQLRRRIALQAAELAESRALLAEAQAFAQLGHWHRKIGPPDEVKWSEETYCIHERDPRLGPPATFDELAATALPADAIRWRFAYQRAFHEKGSYQLDLAIEPRPGLRKFIHVRGRAEVDPAGKLVAIFGTVQDITARRSAELARQQSEQLLRALYENLPNALGVLDHTDNGWELVSLNPEAVRLTGFSTAIPPGENASTPATPALLNQPWWRELIARADVATSPVRFQFRREDLRREFSAVLVPMQAPDSRSRCCFLIDDITDRRLRDAEVAQGRRLRAIGEMVGGIAHEFNNLLTPILVTAETLAAADRHDTGLRADHQLIASAARRAADLTRRLLTFERRSDSKPELVSLPAVIDANLDLLRHTTDRRIRFVNTLGSDTPALQLNTGDLNQIVLNLLLNARDTLEEKLARSSAGWSPVITVDVASLPASATTPQEPSPLPAPDRWLRLGVTDNGLGMPSPVIERIFDPFYSTKQVGRGTGLGLATVWHLVSGLGGRIEVQSTQEVGTRFFVFLPVRSEPVIPVPAPASASVATITTTSPALRLLIAEDEAAIASVLKNLLKREGHSLTLATNGREGWELFQQDPDGFDALLLDINMPEITGIELARRVRDAGYRGALIIMSGRITEEVRASLAALSVTAIVDKPFTLESLRAALRTAHPTA